MAQFEIEQFEIHVSKYTVEAGSEAEAIAKLLQDDPNIIFEDSEYVEIATDYGLSVDDNPDLAEGLHALGVRISQDTIDSIRSVKQV